MVFDQKHESALARMKERMDKETSPSQNPFIEEDPVGDLVPQESSRNSGLTEEDLLKRSDEAVHMADVMEASSASFSRAFKDTITRDIIV